MVLGIEQLRFFEALEQEQNQISVDISGIPLTNDRVKAAIRQNLINMIDEVGHSNVRHIRRDEYHTWDIRVPVEINEFHGTDEMPVINGYLVRIKFCPENEDHPSYITVMVVECSWHDPEAMRQAAAA